MGVMVCVLGAGSLLMMFYSQWIEYVLPAVYVPQISLRVDSQSGGSHVSNALKPGCVTPIVEIASDPMGRVDDAVLIDKASVAILIIDY